VASDLPIVLDSISCGGRLHLARSKSWVLEQTDCTVAGNDGPTEIQQKYAGLFELTQRVGESHKGVTVIIPHSLHFEMIQIRHCAQLNKYHRFIAA